MNPENREINREQPQIKTFEIPTEYNLQSFVALLNDILTYFEKPTLSEEEVKKLLDSNLFLKSEARSSESNKPENIARTTLTPSEAMIELIKSLWHPHSMHKITTSQNSRLGNMTTALEFLHRFQSNYNNTKPDTNPK